jgi:DNA invertase Pin-like site-specific DNA recombinase
MTSLKVATERGRIGGRPPALDEEDIPHIRSLMQNDKVSAAQTYERFGIKRLGISKATLYRYVGARQGVGAVGGPARSSLASQKRGVNQ